MQPQTQALKLPEVKRRVRMSHPSIYRAIKRGEFPPPLKCGRLAWWPESTIEAFIAGTWKGDSSCPR